MNDFDGIAWCYDPLKRLIFGDTLDRASSHFLPKINPGARILILGGGTGKILQDVPDGVHITFLDKSEKMLQLAQKRPQKNVEFVNADFLNFQPPLKFDWVICPFFLDLFDSGTLNKVIRKIADVLVPGGELLVSDFTYRKSLLIRVMYVTFRIVSRVEARKIPPILKSLEGSGFQQLDSITFLNGLVFSCHHRQVSN
ncbi:MAG: class I SAM-dependent methyltransferase [Cyclobacteriaceae bacterium]|nr:class I SAM-dependent methyltransferase [Cyclobacteriaceae bacterium SS2]